MTDSIPFYDPTVPPPHLKPRPREVDISITGKCNLKCKYCSYADEMTALSDLPTERWVRYRRQIPINAQKSCRDCPYVNFCTGGCPATIMNKFGHLNAVDPLICYRAYKSTESKDEEAMKKQNRKEHS